MGEWHATRRRFGGAAMACVLGVPLVLSVGACSFDWDALDPALGAGAAAGAGTGGQSTSTGTPSSTGGGGTAAGGTGGGTGGATPWYDTEFSRRRQLSLGEPGEALADFPVMVRLDDSRIDYASVQSAGQDLRFVAPDHATVLDYEIEVFDSTGLSTLWVKVPQIAPGSSSNHIWMYYGNAQASDGQNPDGVWSHGYLAVWHMDPGLADSSGAGHGGTNGGTQDAAGQAGRARRFDGTADYVHVGSPAGLANVFDGGGTLSAWIEASSWGAVSHGRILDKSISTFANEGWGWQLHDGWGSTVQCLRLERAFSTDLGAWLSEANSIVLHQGHFVALAYDDSDTANEPVMYVDGASQVLVETSQPVGIAESDASSPLRIGNYGSGTERGFDGVIDEVRVATDLRSPHWIAGQHASLTDTLITFGPEEEVP